METFDLKYLVHLRHYLFFVLQNWQIEILGCVSKSKTISTSKTKQQFCFIIFVIYFCFFKFVQSIRSVLHLRFKFWGIKIDKFLNSPTTLRWSVSKNAFETCCRLLTNSFYCLPFKILVCCSPFRQAADEDGIDFGDGITMETIMKPWVRQSGFPVVTVTRRYTGEEKITILASQKRFLADPALDTPSSKYEDFGWV